MALVSTTLPDDDRASETIVRVVASVEDVSPTDLTPPLYSVVDPDAIDAFVESARTRSSRDWELDFDYNGYTVRVFADEEPIVQVDRSSD